MFFIILVLNNKLDMFFISNVEETSSLDGTVQESERPPQGIDSTNSILAKHLTDINLLLLEPPKVCCLM